MSFKEISMRSKKFPKTKDMSENLWKRSKGLRVCGMGFKALQSKSIMCLWVPSNFFFEGLQGVGEARWDFWFGDDLRGSIAFQNVSGGFTECSGRFMEFKESSTGFQGILPSYVITTISIVYNSRRGIIYKMLEDNGREETVQKILLAISVSALKLVTTSTVQHVASWGFSQLIILFVLRGSSCRHKFSWVFLLQEGNQPERHPCSW